MRHGKKINHLSRTASHRSAMLANMACSLIEHKRINTTVAKAKALRKYIEPLVTKSKADTTHSRRVVFSYLKQKEAVTELFKEVSVKVADRPGGYTRIIKTGNRLGDNAEMCMIELVDYNEIYTSGETKKKKSRRGAKKKSSVGDVAAAAASDAAETVAESSETVADAVEETIEEAKDEITDSASESEKEDENPASEDEKA
ncbi:MAG: 50S ribosomal protein L17 [Bacteroidetes bacterium]|jgi:large subunit ribosomal protein L17|nr:50S ribosomal protein L17 [Bacteroidota bacterium]